MRLYDNKQSGTVLRARALRRNASAPEKRLLRGLREAFPDLKWRHQAQVGPFYADILCFTAKLIIEVDGDTHAQADDYDTRRTQFLKHEGYNVLRFGNPDVMTNLEGILTQISFSLREKERARAAQPCGKVEGDQYDHAKEKSALV
ncbi:endonuclease domain-containing protein [Sphingomonas faeni]|uniref:endonuclease domain-containing protein n=1 Tax=Sphingomonas faeni TaxID=185950 RepID=UPI0033650EF8